MTATWFSRWVKKVAREAGIGHAHPHQLRHTLATQAVNRGMRIEAVAELLGHRNLRMTQVYARISNRTVADQFAAVSERVDSLYADPDSETPSMRRLRLEHRRLLANGWCTRPQELGCHFEAICEGCGFFETTVEFLPILRRQRDHAAARPNRTRGPLRAPGRRRGGGPAMNPADPGGAARPTQLSTSARPPSWTTPCSASACCAARCSWATPAPSSTP